MAKVTKANPRTNLNDHIQDVTIPADKGEVLELLESLEKYVNEEMFLFMETFGWSPRETPFSISILKEKNSNPFVMPDHENTDIDVRIKEAVDNRRMLWTIYTKIDIKKAKDLLNYHFCMNKSELQGILTILDWLDKYPKAVQLQMLQHKKLEIAA